MDALLRPMKPRTRTPLAMVAFLACAAATRADDLLTPPWPRGAAYSDFSVISFDGAPDVAGLWYPDPGYYGVPAVVPPFYEGVWEPTYAGRTGVLRALYRLQIYAGTYWQLPERDIYLQVVSHADGPCGTPYLCWLSGDTLPATQTDSFDLAGGWHYDRFYFHFNPQIDWRGVLIPAQGGLLIIDQLVYDAFPEPGTLALLAALAVVGRPRGRCDPSAFRPS